MPEPDNDTETIERPLTLAEAHENGKNAAEPEPAADTASDQGPDPAPVDVDSVSPRMRTVHQSAMTAANAVTVIEFAEGLMGPQMAPQVLQKAVELYPMLEFYRRDARKRERKAERAERRQEKKERLEAARNAADILKARQKEAKRREVQEDRPELHGAAESAVSRVVDEMAES